MAAKSVVPIAVGICLGTIMMVASLSMGAAMMVSASSKAEECEEMGGADATTDGDELTPCVQKDSDHTTGLVMLIIGSILFVLFVAIAIFEYNNCKCVETSCPRLWACCCLGMICGGKERKHRRNLSVRRWEAQEKQVRRSETFIARELRTLDGSPMTIEQLAELKMGDEVVIAKKVKRERLLTEAQTQFEDDVEIGPGTRICFYGQSGLWKGYVYEVTRDEPPFYRIRFDDSVGAIQEISRGTRGAIQESIVQVSFHINIRTKHLTNANYSDAHRCCFGMCHSDPPPTREDSLSEPGSPLVAPMAPRPISSAEGSEPETEPAAGPEKGQAMGDEPDPTGDEPTPDPATSEGWQRPRPLSGDSSTTPQAFDVGSGRMTPLTPNPRSDRRGTVGSE